MLVRQAFDGARIAEIQVDGEARVAEKLDRAARCFADRANWLPPYRRIEILRRLARLLEREFDALAILIAREGGKPLADARVETARSINGVESAIGDLEHLAGREIPMGLSAASQDRWAFTTKEPIGVVAAISAFNHPLNLIVHQVVPAIATGCPVIVKPANTTPLCCLRFVELVHEAGLPEEWCQTLIVEENSLAERFATDRNVAFLSFIGSAKVGWYLRSKLPPGTRCALEHGGAAPVIVDRSVEVDTIIEPLVRGGYYHAGQVCVSAQRIFVHAEIMPRLVERLTERVRALRVGDPTSPDTEVGPLILPKEVDRVATWVAEARDAGGTIATGGAPVSERIYEPTVIVKPPTTVRLSHEEVFGPVICIYPFSDLSEAVAQSNSLPFAFQASVFSRDIDTAMRTARSLDASTVLINDHTAFRVDWMPFAGRHQSGYGVGGISYTMHDMTQEKMVILRC
jgi:acyl-CoA reductase-like NAD-dependent aldehyde dehydrogenase